MPTGLILAIDQGTTNTKALLVNAGGRPVFRTSSPVPLAALPNGFVEQDPLALWESVVAVMAEAQAYAAASGSQIEGLAISNQRETAIAWNADTGEPVASAVSWQCGRGAATCERHASHSQEVRSITGLPLAPLISASKWAWLFDNEPALATLSTSGALRLGTVDTWLIYKLTDGAVHATDLTNASRTGLLSLQTLAWSKCLLELFGIPFAALPSLHCSSDHFGHCSGVKGFEHVPILAAIGDSHAALVGQGSFSPGTVKATYGTGSSLIALTQDLPSDTPSLARTVAWSAAGKAQFALEGNIAMTGSAVQWAGEFLRLPHPAADIAALSETVADSRGLYFVPAMVGLGAPHWDADARGVITGLSRAHTSAHLARAALDAIAYQVADVFFAMEQQTGLHFHELRADGGATRNTSLMQFQADILGRPVLRSSDEELSAIGAAWLAALQLGWSRSIDELGALRPAPERFEPRINSAERTRLYSGWKRAVRCATTPEEETA